MEIFEVKWSSYKSPKKYLIGLLFHDQKYIFQYNHPEIKTAIQEGFRPFPEFKDINKTYVSEELFATFKMRIGERKSFDEDNNFAREEGRLATDRIFIKQKGLNNR